MNLPHPDYVEIQRLIEQNPHLSTKEIRERVYGKKLSFSDKYAANYRIREMKEILNR